MTEIVEIHPMDNDKNWQPLVDKETFDLLKSKGFADSYNRTNASGERILNETRRIMEACGSPLKDSNCETGIVIGYVQSGKTLSFTTLTALARDNNYQIVIVIAGVSTNLTNQSTERLADDLSLNTRFDRKWSSLKNPSGKQDGETIEIILEQWKDPTFPAEKKRTLLITVMKNASHLNNLVEILRSQNLNSVPTLIIDDEGDQASLNTRARRAKRLGIDVDTLSESQVSTIYRRITDLRAVFSHHTFLQYTATPQANLFINIMDRFSPNFIRLLTPGEDYVGGEDFFIKNPNLIIEIPPEDIGSSDNPLYEIPESLKRALQIYFLGVVSGEGRNEQRNRSMLVHPSRLQDDHSEFTRWIRNTCHSWQRLLSENDGDDKAELLKEFESSYEELKQTVPDIQKFEELAGVGLEHVLKYTRIIEVNSRNGETPKINWSESYSWILVGGQSMDRGFTVEGLTVTYMPRSIGTGNVDTIQQRARFFGYKRSYLGFCRVFLDQVSIDSYSSIVIHEEDVRNRLLEYDLNNRHLNEWDREVVLDGMLNLTRRNVIYDDLDRDRFGCEWFRIRAPHDTLGLIELNRLAVFNFLNSREECFLPDDGHPDRTEAQRHLVSRMSLKDCLENLLNKLRFTRESDSVSYSSLRGVLKRYLDNISEEECLVYLMSTNSISNWNARDRKLNKDDEIQQLFQGRNPKSGVAIYPGDTYIKSEDLLTIQIHLLNFRDTDYVDVPSIAIWVPGHMGSDIIRQS